MAISMRPSRLLRRLRAGELAFSFKLNFADARELEIPAMCGFDVIWTCMEHVPNDLSVIEKQILTAKYYDVDTMVRVSRGGYSDYIRPLEMDAAGIMVPHVMSLEDARRVVWMTRFHPIGRRPLDGGNADGAFCGIPPADYIRQANEQRFVVIQIEDPEPLEELDAIAALDGIDVIYFGPGDFSHSIGVVGQLDHPEVVAASKRIAEVARKHSKFAGTVATLDNVDEIIAQGYQFINLGSDVAAMWSLCRNIGEEMTKRR